MLNKRGQAIMARVMEEGFDVLNSIDREYAKEIIIKIIGKHPEKLIDLSYSWQVDLDVLNAAILGNEDNLSGVLWVYKRMNKRAQINPAVCRFIMEVIPGMFPHLNYMDDYIIRTGLSSDGMNLAYISEENDNREYVMLAVEENGLALAYAADHLKDDFEIVYAAVTNNGMAIDSASERLQRNHHIQQASIANLSSKSKKTSANKR